MQKVRALTEGAKTITHMQTERKINLYWLLYATVLCVWPSLLKDSWSEVTERHTYTCAHHLCDEQAYTH